MNVFIHIEPDNIFVKCNEEVVPKLVDAFLDNDRKLHKSSPETWDYNIEIGKSYEIETKEEVEEFITNNLKYRKLNEV